MKVVLVVMISLICEIRPVLSNKDDTNVELCNTPTAVNRAVHFYAAHPSSISGSLNPIPFSDVTLNEGFAFSGSSGIFTAPVNGIYQFFFSFQSSRNNLNGAWWLQVNGVAKVLCHSQVSTGSTVGSMCTYMTQLAQNDKVTVKQDSGNAWGTATTNTITFSGSLLMQKC
ncbi:cerebellin-4-like isoform X1 [Alosa sapidissima]|uniref:cerebellin-4-like isoform X1 n=1 Tax=Alosa sapidissima TaxID=34773 RepID=UPI001C093401|nr:cerebellin-4-like isoform X1 [Alosa sapidissima]